MGWAISALATFLSLSANWLYGSKDWRGPILGVCASFCWIWYDVAYQQWPLLLTTVIYLAGHLRNLRNMWRDDGGVG